MCERVKVHRHRLRPVMKAIEEEERRARLAEVEVEVEAETETEAGSLEGRFNKSCGLLGNGSGVDGWEGNRIDEAAQTRGRCYADQTEWMGIRAAGKARDDGFW